MLFFALLYAQTASANYHSGGYTTPYATPASTPAPTQTQSTQPTNTAAPAVDNNALIPSGTQAPADMNALNESVPGIPDTGSGGTITMGLLAASLIMTALGIGFLPRKQER